MRGVLFFLLVAAVIALLLPPFFTHGACTAEFDAVADLLEGARPQLLTLPRAQEFLDAHRMAYQTLTGRQCEAARPREVDVAK